MDRPHALICPKCGYDQSGQVATWEDRCPMGGICPECGLGFDWADVFHPERLQAGWYAEHGGSLWAILKRIPGTLRWLLLPHVFWRELDVAKRVSIRGLVVFLLVLLVGTHLVVAVPYGAACWRGISFGQFPMKHGLNPYAKLLFNGLAMPFYSAYIDATAPVVSLRIHSRGGLGSHDVHQQVLRPVGFQAGFMLMWMVVLLAVPRTRKLARLRGVHVVRGALLSGAGILLTLEILRLTWALHTLSGWAPRLAGPMLGGIVAISIAWQIAFWACAIVIGWRIRPWLLLVALGTLAGALGGVLVRVCLFVMAPS